jgi:hypothetical protein
MEYALLYHIAKTEAAIETLLEMQIEIYALATKQPFERAKINCANLLKERAENRLNDLKKGL